MPADTLTAEERAELLAWADDFADTLAMLTDDVSEDDMGRFGRLVCLARIASSELIQLGEAAVKFSEFKHDPKETMGTGIRRLGEAKHAMLEAARTYALSLKEREG